MTRHPLADAAGGGGQRASECREASGDTDGVSDPFFLRLFSQHASHSSDVCGPLTTAKGEQKGWVPGCCGWPPRSPKTGGPVLESWSPRWHWAGCSSPPPKSTGSAGCGPSWYIEKGVKRSSTVVLYRSVSGGGGSVADSPSAVSSPWCAQGGPAATMGLGWRLAGPGTFTGRCWRFRCAFAGPR